MTPPAASAAGRLPRTTVPRVPRRVSGPAAPPRRPAGDAPRTARAPLPARAARRLAGVPDSRFLDRLDRGRGWIAIVAIGLMGIVFMQVSLLKLNAGIGRAVTTADTLEGQNSRLRDQISTLDSGQRIQDVASRLGMVMTPAGEMHYLDARGANAARAAANIVPPGPVLQQSSVQATTAATTAPTTTPSTVTPASTTPASTTPATATAAATAAAPQG